MDRSPRDIFSPRSLLFIYLLLHFIRCSSCRQNTRKYIMYKYSLLEDSRSNNEMALSSTAVYLLWDVYKYYTYVMYL